MTVIKNKITNGVDIKAIRHFELGPNKEDLERMEKAKEQTGKEEVEIKHKGKYKP